MIYKTYTLDGKFLREETNYYTDRKLTGIVEKVSNSSYEKNWHAWYFEGKLHRLNGPAVEWADGIKEWYLYGEKVTELQCKCLHDIMKLKGII